MRRKGVQEGVHVPPEKLGERNEIATWLEVKKFLNAHVHCHQAISTTGKCLLCWLRGHNRLWLRVLLRGPKWEREVVQGARHGAVMCMHGGAYPGLHHHGRQPRHLFRVLDWYPVPGAGASHSGVHPWQPI